MHIKNWLLALVLVTSGQISAYSGLFDVPSETITVYFKQPWKKFAVSTSERVWLVDQRDFPCRIMYDYSGNFRLEHIELHGITRDGRTFDVVDPVSKKVVWHVTLRDSWSLWLSGNTASCADVVYGSVHPKTFYESVMRRPRLDLCNHKPECQTLCACGAGLIELELMKGLVWYLAS